MRKKPCNCGERDLAAIAQASAEIVASDELDAHGFYIIPGLVQRQVMDLQDDADQQPHHR